VGAAYERDPAAVFDWAVLVVGVALIWVPFLLPPDGLGRIGLVSAGVVIMGFALTARASRGERWHWQLLAANVGLWLVAMPAMWYDLTRVYHYVSAIAGGLVILLMIGPLWAVYRRASLARAKTQTLR
jgi:hypothetical protein